MKDENVLTNVHQALYDIVSSLNSIAQDIAAMFNDDIEKEHLLQLSYNLANDANQLQSEVFDVLEEPEKIKEEEEVQSKYKKGNVLVARKGSLKEDGLGNTFLKRTGDFINKEDSFTVRNVIGDPKSKSYWYFLESNNEEPLMIPGGFVEKDFEVRE